METVNKVKLTICGTDYVVTTDETPGYMQELGAQLGRIRLRMRPIAVHSELDNFLKIVAI